MPRVPQVPPMNRRNLWETCVECASYLEAHPLIIPACASVGVEAGKSTRQMMVEYFIEMHERDHFTAISRSN